MSNRPCSGRKLERRERVVPDVIQPHNEIRTRLVPSTLWRRTSSTEKREEKLTHSDVLRARKNGDPSPGNSLFRALPAGEYHTFAPMNINAMNARSLKARKIVDIYVPTVSLATYWEKEKEHNSAIL